MGLHLSNVAEGAEPEAHAYLRDLLDLHQSLDWAAAGPYLARRVGGEDNGAAREFVHCDKRLVAGRIGLHEGMRDMSYPYAAGGTATSAPPESGWGAPGAVSPHQRKRTRGAAERPPARGAPSGGPPAQSHPPWDRRPARRLPRPGYRTTRPWGRDRTSAEGTLPPSVRAPWRLPTRVRQGRFCWPTGRR